MSQKKGSHLLKQTYNVCPDWKSLLPILFLLSGKDTSEFIISRSPADNSHQEKPKAKIGLTIPQNLSVHTNKVLLLCPTEEKNQIPVVQRGTK